MAAEQIMTHAILQAAIGATKAAIMAITEVDNQMKNTRPVHPMEKSGGPALKQPTFDLKAADKYQELSCHVMSFP